MTYPSRSVLLIGFQNQVNLGLGYLSAVLISNGYHVRMVDVAQGSDAILQFIRRDRPVLVGFSLIFQYYIERYAELASFLRSRDVDCHMTIGGHYPSLCYEKTMEQIPQMDSVVLFEGEETLLELVRHLSNGQDWRNTHGIAYRNTGQVVLNPLRPLIAELDKLPFPYRPVKTNETLGKKIQPILGSRGCPRLCSFCSIIEFYGKAPGKSVRRRTPANVACEMKELYEESNSQIFLFQDDDFPVLGKAGRRWISSFINELGRQKLLGHVIWKFSCRVDEIEKQLFADMRDAGLYLVYLGIESGTEEGLKVLNKRVNVRDSLRAVEILKELNLMFGYGFMLFDPGSTFNSVRENIQFLREIVGDGRAAVNFCKMLPYAGTAIERELAATGRLRGSSCRPDYLFLDPLLDDYFEKLQIALASWVHEEDAVSQNLNMAWHELAVIKRLFPRLTGIREYEEFLQDITQKSNERILLAVEETALEFESEGIFHLDAEEMRIEAREVVETFLHHRNSFVYVNQDRILGVLAADAA
jgi:radical SAM superfamily enzyme YgiQ (UPF0313 family)